ncbi:poly-gamma-glutamate synthesis protein (capsule biosynthesis protein) [Salirhabdus euzebyi]|uniref:Poly-gamma-glutamate synthesis protein (Capsule biosynthesis protein) n=1 Tax=Salirhabdus euzebyi TaxID=394506 RepID=A0A841Q8V2_9BACI|nr:CapA family protein [Salirhabdus euzebyi]MBB6454815.1 poly-gamma-glutamate synthesis protein (capsule biosynthesis protein) [Salirhabdus euzebyi]
MNKFIISIGLVVLATLSIIGFVMTSHGQSKNLQGYATHSVNIVKMKTKTHSLDDFNLLPKEPITVLFAGDTLFDWSVKTAVQLHGPDYPFAFVKDEVKEADISILNLETAVTKEKEKDPSQLYNFKSDPIALQGVKNAGFDAVSIANNHALDYQVDGFLDTMNYLREYELDYFGGGKNKEEAYEALTVELKGRNIKFLGFSRFIPAVHWYEGEGPVIASGYQRERVIQTIEEEAVDTDVLFVYIHWGVEGNNKPEEWQRDYARKMIDAGADAIIGAHPHVLQGFEYYKGKPIAYSLGNFLFPDYVSGKTAQTGLLTVTIDGDLMKMKFNPYIIKANQIHPLEGTKDQEILKYLEDISYGIDIEDYEIAVPNSQ